MNYISNNEDSCILPHKLLEIYHYLIGDLASMFQLTNPLVARLRLVAAGAVVAVLLSCQNLQNQWPHLLLHIMHFIFHFILRRICLFVACLNRFLALFVLKSYFYFCISTYAHLQLLSENDWYFVLILVLTCCDFFLKFSAVSIYIIFNSFSR